MEEIRRYTGELLTTKVGSGEARQAIEGGEGTRERVTLECNLLEVREQVEVRGELANKANTTKLELSNSRASAFDKAPRGGARVRASPIRELGGIRDGGV